MQIAEEIASIDRTRLTPLVAKALGRPDATILEHFAQPIAYKVSNPVSAALVRFRGRARVDEGERAWSLVLKVLRKAEEAQFSWMRADPASLARFREMSRWDREALAYGSRILEDLAVGLVAPRCMDVEWKDGDAAWLWLEDVGDEDDRRWDLDRYALAARHLGRFNGGYLVGKPLPDADWLSHDALEAWTEAFGGNTSEILEDDTVWSDPLVVELFEPDARARLRDLWRERTALYALLRDLPATFAHLDAFRGNLLSRDVGGQQETVAIDWSFCGLAAVGAEASQLVGGTVFYLREPLEPDQLAAAVFEGYLAGLRDVGWEDASVVRKGFLAATVIRWGFHLLRLNMIRDPELRSRLEQRTGLPLREHIAPAAAKTHFALAQAAELERLLS